jgi:hypothetical protein
MLSVKRWLLSLFAEEKPDEGGYGRNHGADEVWTVDVDVCDRQAVAAPKAPIDYAYRRKRSI